MCFRNQNFRQSFNSITCLGELDDAINVVDFPPGVHIAAITVLDGNLTSNTESFTFITPGM